MQIDSQADNLHEKSKPIFLIKEVKYYQSILPAEFVQRVVTARVCVCVWGGGGWEGGGNFLYRHSADVRAEWPPFSALPGKWLAPLFPTKSIWPYFSGFLRERLHFFWHLVYAHNFRTEIFEAAYFLCITWIDCDICLTTSNKWVQNMNRSTFWMIKYMNGSVFSKARYTNGVRFEILARTPVLKLP